EPGGQFDLGRQLGLVRKLAARDQGENLVVDLFTELHGSKRGLPGVASASGPPRACHEACAIGPVVIPISPCSDRASRWLGQPAKGPAAFSPRGLAPLDRDADHKKAAATGGNACVHGASGYAERCSPRSVRREDGRAHRRRTTRRSPTTARRKLTGGRPRGSRSPSGLTSTRSRSRCCR